MDVPRSIRAAGSAAVLLAALLGSPVAWEPAAAPKPRIHTVTIAATRFQPEVLVVNAGDTIVWANEDFFPHTATSEAAGFDSGAILTAKSWKYRVTKKGEFPYICTFHPTMKGTLRVR